MNEYRSKLGPIPEEHFEGEPSPISEEEVVRRYGGRSNEQIVADTHGERPKEKGWDESKHPRDPAGSSTGGQFTSGGGGEASEKPAATEKPAAEAKPKKKTERADFSKSNILLDPDTQTDAKKLEKFLLRWNNSVDLVPEEFKKEFLGGLAATMRMYYNDRNDQLTISGQILDEDKKVIAEYSRDIDFDDNYAYSAYFKIKKGETGGGAGKKMLAGNVAMYQKLGLDKLKVTANIDVGGYAWARYGYLPTPDAWRSLGASLAGKIQNMQGGEKRASGGDPYTPESWGELSDDEQSRIQNAWMESTR